METLTSAFVDATSSIPGYGVIAQILLQSYGVDAGKLASKYIIIFAICKAVIWLWDKIYDFLQDHFTSVVEIDDYDSLWNQLIDWAATQSMTKKSREIKTATGISKTLQTDDDESLRDPEDDDDVLGADGLFSFEKWDSKNPIIYKPNTQCEFFTFNGRWFQWATSERKNVGGRGVDQLIYIRCLGRSTKPIKEFLNYIKSWTRNKEVETTSVYRSAAKSAQGGGEWNRQSVRPSRPLETVSLDDAQKAKIVRDINEYMHPATARWYAAQGIPHRRGYLFHGPPGTGKTSLSFSLAGIFGLSIYCVSLSETGLTETELGALFASLPERCIVLLEDIDSAGIRREDDALSMTAMRNADGSEESSDSKSGSESNPKTVFEEDTQPKGWFRFLYRALVKPVIKDVVAMTPTRENVTNGMPFPNRFNRKQSLISLAGLLNIIDGAASHEGRVLIMTTNYPEQLDPALIRPGRVDLQIRFTLATRDQICDIFKRMYNTDLDKKNPIFNNGSIIPPAPGARNSITDTVAIAPAVLAELASQFAAALPEEVFSPAEIQGYLLMKKTEPEGAVREVRKWKNEQIEARKKGNKVVGDGTTGVRKGDENVAAWLGNSAEREDGVVLEHGAGPG